MYLKQIVHRRLQAQRISSTTFTRAEEVVTWLGAIQAQDYLGALWAVGLRLTDATERDIERALVERTIVRTWPMRGTLHFVAAADARWITDLLAARPVAGAESRLRSFGIDKTVLTRARRVLVKNLEGGRRLTRPTVYRVLEDAGVGTSSQRGLHILWRLAQDCLVCFGPRDGKQQTFVLFDEWLPQAKTLPREEALATLAHRYFTGHGPATLPDFVWWSGLKITDARHAIRLVDNQIKEQLVDGQRYWSGDNDSAPVRVSASTKILPAFDEFLVGYTDRSAVFDNSASERVNAGGIFDPVVVVNGQVVGTWKRRIERREVVCSVAPFVRLNRATSQAITQALQRYSHFLGLDLRQEKQIDRVALR